MGPSDSQRLALEDRKNPDTKTAMQRKRGYGLLIGQISVTEYRCCNRETDRRRCEVVVSMAQAQVGYSTGYFRVTHIEDWVLS